MLTRLEVGGLLDTFIHGNGIVRIWESVCNRVHCSNSSNIKNELVKTGKEDNILQTIKVQWNRKMCWRDIHN